MAFVECEISSGSRETCGPEGISESDCAGRDCCYDDSDDSCYASSARSNGGYIIYIYLYIIYIYIYIYHNCKILSISCVNGLTRDELNEIIRVATTSEF